MDLDSKWYDGEAARDVYETLRNKELQLFRTVKRSSCSKRREVINWMMELSNGLVKHPLKFTLHPRTTHLAVYLFDICMLCRKPPLMDRIFLVAAAALVVATKFEESTFASVVWRAVLDIFPNTPIDDIREAEQSVLRAVNWQLLVPTVVSYVPYFIAATDASGRAATCFGSRKHYWYRPEFVNMVEQHRQMGMIDCDFFEPLVYTFCGLSLKGTAYKQFRYSEIAASALAAARFCIHALPTWPSSMGSLTSYMLDNLFNCIHFLLHDFDCERRQNPRFFPQLNRCDYAARLLAARSVPPRPLVKPCPKPSIPVNTSFVLEPPVPPISRPLLQISPTATYVPALLVLWNLPTGQRIPVICAVQTATVSTVDPIKLVVSSSEDTSGCRAAKRMKLDSEEERG